MIREENDIFQFKRPGIAVHEPFRTQITGTTVVTGQITKEYPLVVSSNMERNGVIFSDGIQEDYLEFNIGRRATIKPADRKVYLMKKFN